MHVGMSELHLEHNDLESATQQLVQSKEQGEHTGFPQHPYRWRVTMARVKQAQGDFDGALDLLDEAEPRYVSDFRPNVRPVAALKTRVWVAQGQLAKASGWVRERILSFDDDLSYLREFEHVTLARILIARYRQGGDKRSIQEAMRLLERLLNAAEAGERTGSVIEILVLQASAHEALGDVSRGLETLGRALHLAEPEGYVRMFLDEGPLMAGLLAEATAQRILPDYTGRLLAAFAKDVPTSEGASAPASTSQSLLEPLSARELEVLRLIAEGHSNHEIGDQLYLALSTVKGHNRVIFGKLGVQRRTEAVARARELGLL
jgi:LuxR family maltose regulon positive regulatory protein